MLNEAADDVPPYIQPSLGDLMHNSDHHRSLNRDTHAPPMLEQPQELPYQPNGYQVMLITPGAAIMGHGRRYAIEIAKRLISAGVRTTIITSASASLEQLLSELSLPYKCLGSDHAILDRSRYARFGRLASLVRGLVRLKLQRNFMRECFQVAKQHSESSKVVLHFLDYEYLSLSWILRRIERTPNIRAFVTIHPSDFSAFPPQRLADIYKLFVKHSLRTRLSRIPGIFTHGEWIASRLRNQLGNNLKITAIDYPSESIDLRVDKSEARKKLGIETDTRVILWFGIIRKDKRLDLAIEALRRLQGNYRLLVAGAPADYTSNQINDWIIEADLKQRVILHLKYIEEAEIPLFFSAADLLLATHESRFSSASGPVADARTYRLPVIVSNAGQLSHYVKQFDVGEVSLTDHHEDYAAAIERAFTSERYLQLVNNVDSAASKLDWDNFVSQHLLTYGSYSGFDS